MRRVDGTERVDASTSPSGVVPQLAVTKSKLEPAEAPKLATWRCDLRIAFPRLDRRITITPPLSGHRGGYIPNCACSWDPTRPCRQLDNSK